MLSERAASYIDFLEQWIAALPTMPLAGVLTEPLKSAVMCVDIINGFCTTGPLSSPRIQAIVPPIARLFQSAYDHGVRHFVLPQDTHEPEAVEFGSYPAHCVRGDRESQTVPELAGLPFARDFVVIEKNSISSSQNTALDNWLDQHAQISTFIVTGDCSDLCTHQLAMHLRLRANARQTSGVRIIVPADCVQTYDTPIEAARKLGISPHPGDLLHAIFLHNMATNGVEVVGRLK
ncbi:MAG: cysteine hydrolase [Chloroflexi bacterium]|nr:cysteine hydrolase [Chloroflexota bacterium]MCL5273892.1 cysteine hydrolase [Chloroflexota bacterium]